MRSTSALTKDGLERFVIGKAEEFMELTAEDGSVDLLFGEEGARKRYLVGKGGEGQAGPDAVGLEGYRDAWQRGRGQSWLGPVQCC
jgi:hypothetical protein